MNAFFIFKATVFALRTLSTARRANVLNVRKIHTDTIPLLDVKNVIV